MKLQNLSLSYSPSPGHELRAINDLLQPHDYILLVRR